MKTPTIVARDGIRVAYDVTGTGPALILLHGGGQNRRVWHDAGYVTRLCDQFTVITMDIRGNGESDKPTDASAYAIGCMVDDILSVADAAHAPQFALCGYSYGGNIGRYVPARTGRVSKLVILGIAFGPAAPAGFREHALALRDKWSRVIQADRAGSPDLSLQSEQDRVAWQKGSVPLAVAQLSAILDWPPVEPADLCCPTLWVVGSENHQAMSSVKEYQERLAGTNVVLHVLPGLTHADELTSMADVLPPICRFLREGLYKRPHVS